MHIGDVEITKREILFSIIILLVGLALGFIIAESIERSVVEKNQEYYKAAKIYNDSELFSYGMTTGIGNALVSGTIIAIEPVSLIEMRDAHYAVRRITQRYTRKTKVVTKTRVVNGKTQTYTETVVYYDWDTISRDDKRVKEFEFLDNTFSSDKITVYGWKTLDLSDDTLEAPYADWVRYSYVYDDGDMFASVGDLRYKYEYIPKTFDATLFTDLRNATINDTKLHRDQSIDSIITQKQNSVSSTVTAFWFGWTIFILFGIGAFIYIDNRWLEG